MEQTRVVTAVTSVAAGSLLFGRYLLEEQLGFGGSAEVWRARDETSGRPVAVKLLHRHLLPEPKARQRFAQEARAASALAHPGIVPVVDVVLRDDAAAIVFEFVEGETLAARIATAGRLEEREAAMIAADVAEALAHAHERGVVHRDVKPGNIMLPVTGGARLVDFGIARSLEQAQAGLTLTGSVVGTLRYMAPEQLAGGRVDSRVDVFALGAVLYEMLAARPSFPADTPLVLAEQQQTGPRVVPGVSTGLLAITLAALQPDPATRVATAAELGRLLHAWLSHVPLPASIMALVAVPQGGPVDANTATVVMPAAAAAPGSLGSGSPSRVRILPPVRPTPSRTRHGPIAAVATALLALLLIAAAALPGLSGPGAGGGTDETTAPNAVSAPTPRPTPRPTVGATVRPTVRPAAQPPREDDKQDQEDKDDGGDDGGDDSGKGGGKGGGNGGKGSGGKGKGNDD